ncbi:hypothetical protein O9993_03740 [Vibrio lentus]|nr:hypothetical protein [Vibrio lentus]
MKSAVRNKGKKALGVAFGIASANAVYIGLCLIGVGSILQLGFSDDRLKLLAVCFWCTLLFKR